MVDIIVIVKQSTELRWHVYRCRQETGKRILKRKGLRLGDIAQLVKCLLHKHEKPDFGYPALM